MKILAAFVLSALVALPASAEIVTRTVEYRQGDALLKGYLAYDDAVEGKRPGVLVVHEWWGLNDYAKSRARQLAEQGYVALAIDMYGDGKNTVDPSQAKEWSGHLRGSPLLRERAQAGYQTLVDMDMVDDDRVGAIGFCFGGTTVLELAYSGLPVDGVVSFHGGLIIPSEQDLSQMKADVLVLHGAEDGFIKPETIAEFQKTLSEAGVDWEMIYYGGAVHSFSNPEADKVGIPGIAYDEDAARRSWQAMLRFFDEVLK
jgi:dienelactone hydrolase